MGIMFYPHEDDLESSSIQEKIETLMEAAERYKAVVLDVLSAKSPVDSKKRVSPRDLTVSFNWEEMAKLLREIRELPEATSVNKLAKANYLEKLAEIYEVLRAAKMTKLEAIRLALVNEANQLKSSAA